MSIANDMKFALRQMVKRPGFTLAVVLTLAIGIGANSAIFSIVNGVLLRPLPYPDANRLVVVNNSYPGLGAQRTEVSIPDYLDRREGVPAFEDSALWHWTSAGITTDSTPDHHSGVRATRTLFSTLQTYPALGRNFTVEDMQPGKDQVVILSHTLWQELFDGNPDALGRELRIDGTVHRVVGVMPRGFAFPDRDAEYFVPFAFTPEQMSDQERGNQFADMLARLAPGATAEQAHAQMQAIIEGLKNRMPEYQEIMDQARITTIVTDLRTVRTDGAEKPLLLLQLCVGFVLLIVCANIANLFLTRGMQTDSTSILHSNRFVVSDDYFKTMQIGLLKGRSFDSSDTADSRRVIVIDEILARKYFAESDPLGREITFDIGDDEKEYWTVVGVAKSVKRASLDETDDKEAIYLPLSQATRADFYVVLRTAGNPESLTALLRDALQRLDSELPAYDVETLHACIDDSLRSERMPMILLAVFADIALLLAAIGLYGVLAFSVPSAPARSACAWRSARIVSGS
ncbi:MAG: ABC transporter permease [Woeseiaceae bacterium]